MRKKIAVLAALACVGATGWAVARPQEAQLAPEVWVKEGDTDGDGLLDDFEARHGLDLMKVDSFGDGKADESRLGADGRTMWEVQEAEAAGSSGTGGSGGTCGLMGLEFLLLVLLLARGRAR